MKSKLREEMMISKTVLLLILLGHLNLRARYKMKLKFLNHL